MYTVYKGPNQIKRTPSRREAVELAHRLSRGNRRDVLVQSEQRRERLRYRRGSLVEAERAAPGKRRRRER